MRFTSFWDAVLGPCPEFALPLSPLLNNKEASLVLSGLREVSPGFELRLKWGPYDRWWVVVERERTTERTSLDG